MNIGLGDYTFEGRFVHSSDLEEKSGAYVIWAYDNEGYVVVIDVGTADNLQSHVRDKDKKDWLEFGYIPIYVSAYYVDMFPPSVVEEHVRSKEKVLLGNKG